jgi:hypothetical protein
MFSWLRICPLVLLLLVGCSSSSSKPAEGPAAQDKLREVGELLSIYSGEFRRGPARVADLARYEQGYPLGYQAILTGEIVVIWGATMPGEGDQTGTEVIVAYEKQTPTEGGSVLLHNRQVRKLTAAEFASMPKFTKS